MKKSSMKINPYAAIFTIGFILTLVIQAARDIGNELSASIVTWKTPVVLLCILLFCFFGGFFSRRSS
jgi:hypothetical protein